MILWKVCIVICGIILRFVQFSMHSISIFISYTFFTYEWQSYFKISKEISNNIFESYILFKEFFISLNQFSEKIIYSYVQYNLKMIWNPIIFHRFGELSQSRNRKIWFSFNFDLFPMSSYENWKYGGKFNRPICPTLRKLFQELFEHRFINKYGFESIFQRLNLNVHTWRLLESQIHLGKY